MSYEISSSTLGKNYNDHTQIEQFLLRLDVSSSYNMLLYKIAANHLSKKIEKQSDDLPVKSILTQAFSFDYQAGEVPHDIKQTAQNLYDDIKTTYETNSINILAKALHPNTTDILDPKIYGILNDLVNSNKTVGELKESLEVINKEFSSGGFKTRRFESITADLYRSCISAKNASAAQWQEVMELSQDSNHVHSLQNGMKSIALKAQYTDWFSLTAEVVDEIEKDPSFLYNLAVIATVHHKCCSELMGNPFDKENLPTQAIDKLESYYPGIYSKKNDLSETGNHFISTHIDHHFITKSTGLFAAIFKENSAAGFLSNVLIHSNGYIGNDIPNDIEAIKTRASELANTIIDMTVKNINEALRSPKIGYVDKVKIGTSLMSELLQNFKLANNTPPLP